MSEWSRTSENQRWESRNLLLHSSTSYCLQWSLGRATRADRWLHHQKGVILTIFLQLRPRNIQNRSNLLNQRKELRESLYQNRRVTLLYLLHHQLTTRRGDWEKLNLTCQSTSRLSLLFFALIDRPYVCVGSHFIAGRKKDGKVELW